MTTDLKRIVLRRGTEAAWTAEATVLATGELGYDTDNEWLRLGDGSTAFDSLPVFLHSELLGATDVDEAVGALISVVPYASRADFLAATIPAPVMTTGWLSNGIVLTVERDASGTISQTDGTKWTPLGAASPDHFAENTTPGTTDMTAALTAVMAFDGEVVFHSSTYRFTSPISVTAPAGLRWKSSGSVLLYDGSVTDSPAVLVTCPIDGQNTVEGIVFDGGDKSPIAGEFRAATEVATPDASRPNILVKKCTGQNTRFSNDIALLSAGLILCGGWGRAWYENCHAQNCFMSLAVTFSSDRSVAGLRTTFHPTNSTTPRSVRINGATVKNVWDEGKTGPEQEADAISIFQSPGTDEPSNDVCTIRDVQLENFGNRAIKLHSAARAVVDGVHISCDSTTLPFTGAMRANCIDAQQGGALISNVDATFDGVWPPVLVGNYTEQADHSRDGAITSGIYVHFTQGTAGETILVKMRSSNLAVSEESNSRSAISDVIATGQIGSVAQMGVRQAGYGAFNLSNIQADCVNDFLLFENNSGTGNVDLHAVGLTQTGTARALIGAVAGDVIDPDWKISAIGCANFTDYEYIQPSPHERIRVGGNSSGVAIPTSAHLVVDDGEDAVQSWNVPGNDGDTAGVFIGKTGDSFYGRFFHEFGATSADDTFAFGWSDAPEILQITKTSAKVDGDFVARGASFKDFGAVGDGATDDSAALALAAASGGKVDGGGLTYLCDTPVALTSGTVFENCTLDFSNIGGTSGITLSGGSKAAAINLTADVAANATTLTMGDTSSLSAEDYLILRSGAVWSAAESVNIGEIVQIDTVDSGTVVTLKSPVDLSYLTADTARIEKLTLVSGAGLRNVKMIGDGSTSDEGARLSFGINTVLDNVEAKDLTDMGVALINCVDTQITRIHAEDISGVLGYTVSMVGCRGVTAGLVSGKNLRHALTIGGTDFPTAGVVVDKVVGIECIAAPFDTHAAVRGVSVGLVRHINSNIPTGGAEDGCVIQGANVTIGNLDLPNARGRNGLFYQSNIDFPGDWFFTCDARISNPGAIGVSVDINGAAKLASIDIKAAITNPVTYGCLVNAQDGDIGLLDLDLSISGHTHDSFGPVRVRRYDATAIDQTVIRINSATDDDNVEHVYFMGTASSNFSNATVSGVINNGAIGVGAVNGSSGTFNVAGLNIIGATTDTSGL